MLWWFLHIHFVVSIHFEGIYEKHYQRSPPFGFHKWIQFARDQKCSFDPLYYQSIEEDLNKFRYADRPNSPSIIRRQLMSLFIYGVDVLYMHERRLWLFNKPTRKTTDVLPWWLEFLKYFEEILPDNFQMGLNYLDEPRIASEISLHDMHNFSFQIPHKYGTLKNLLSNKCIQKEHAKYQYPHSVFLSKDFGNRVNGYLSPVFSQSRFPCFADIRIPMYQHFERTSDLNPLIPLDSLFSSPKLFLPWSQRSSQVMWRGGPSGAPFMDGSPWWLGQRQRLLLKIKSLREQHHPLSPLLNVAFNEFRDCSPSICDAMKYLVDESSYLPIEEQIKARYMLDVDGNGWTNRFMPSLGWGSLILKATYSEEFLQPIVRPYEHYVPVDTDYVNLTDQIQWAIDHDEEVQNIANRARALYEEVFRTSYLQCFLSRVILEYSSLLTDSVPSFPHFYALHHKGSDRETILLRAHNLTKADV
jgi:hypothetical protein